MARAKKLWRPLKVWHSDEWVSFEKAWQRAKKVIWSDLWLMQRDLRQEFLDGRLIMAVRFFAPDGTETMRIILEPACWQWLKINSASSITGWETIPGWAADAHKEERGISCAVANWMSSIPTLTQQSCWPARSDRSARSGSLVGPTGPPGGAVGRQVRKVRRA
jgi:hypothetical protein